MNRRFSRLRIALAFVREPNRVLTVCITIALGTVALIIADGFIERTLSVFREDIIRAHYGHLQVLPGPDNERIGESDGEVRRRVELEVASAYPGAVVAGRLTFAGLIALRERTVGFLGEGIEPANEAQLSKAVRLSAGTSLSATEPSQVLLGEGLARSVGAVVGDRVTLLTNVPGGGVNGVELVVAGLFHTATKAYDDRALRLPLSTAHLLIRGSGVSRLVVLLPDTELAASAAERLRGALAGTGVQIRLWSEMADFYNKTVDLFRRQLGFVRAVITAIVLLASFNALARNVMERQRDIGTMMALGVRRASVARKFVGEALATCAVGAACGAALGASLAALVSYVGIPMPPPPGTAHGFTGGIDFSAGGAALACASMIGVGLVASLLPAIRASRLNVVDALRAER